jgi:hypothetical protein
MGALLALQALTLSGAPAEQRNVALASEGSVVTVSSSTDAV